MCAETDKSAWFPFVYQPPPFVSKQDIQLRQTIEGFRASDGCFRRGEGVESFALGLWSETPPHYVRFAPAGESACAEC